MQQNPEKKESARTAYQDFVKTHFGIDYSKATDTQRSLYLTEFYIREIHNVTKTNISADDIDYGMTDGANDLGADFIYKDDNVVYIFQSKYHRQGGAVAATEIQHFQSVLRRLRNPQWKRNSKVKELLADVDWAKDQFELRFIGLGKIEGQAKQQKDEPLGLPDDVPGLEDRVEIVYSDETELRTEYRNALSRSSGIPGEFTLNSTGTRNNRTGIIEIQSGEHRSFVMVVSANQIVGMHRQYRDALFTLNIRNFIGNTRTNKEIKETALKRGESFFLFNNGISCLAEKVVVSEDRCSLVTTGLQVINGAQTVKALDKAAHDKPAKESLVLVRVTEVEKGYSSGGRFSSEITRFNDTQNVIKVSDFRSNDPVQVNLKDKFDYYRDGRKVEYLPKRTEKVRGNAILIRLEEFAKVVYAFLYDPVRFSGSTSFLFDEGENGGYSKIFGDGEDVYDAMPDDEFRLRSAIWWIAYEFDAALKSFKQGEVPVDEKASLERKWFLIYAARLILQKSFGEQDYKAQLVTLYKGDWEMDDGRVGEWFRTLFEAARESVVYIYLTAKEQEGFNHRNWMRNIKSAEALARYIKHNPGLKLPPIKSGK